MWTFDSRTSPARDVLSVDTDDARQPGDMIVRGASWQWGPHTLFDARQGDWALWFDGTSGEAVSRSRVLDTSKSFVVSTHVRLDDLSSVATALAQETNWTSGWSVGLKLTGCPGALSSCWGFTMRGEGATKTVFSPVSPVAGEWAMLLAEYDKPAARMRLWVCQVGTPDAPATAEPTRAEAPAPAVMGTVTGSLVLGRGQLEGKDAERWTGAIDNVRVFKGEVLAPAKIRRVCQGAEANQPPPGIGGGTSVGGGYTLDDLNPTNTGGL